MSFTGAVVIAVSERLNNCAVAMLVPSVPSITTSISSPSKRCHVPSLGPNSILIALVAIFSGAVVGLIVIEVTAVAGLILIALY